MSPSLSHDCYGDTDDSNPDDPLNKGTLASVGIKVPRKLMIDAANDLAKNRDAFIQNVKTSMRGGSVRGENFDRVLV